jgi:hypothetical protein
MKTYVPFLVSICFLAGSCTIEEPILTIGLVADPQYAAKPEAGSRHYRESLWKLEEAVDSFNFHQVDFVQSLGDIIDEQWESFDSILPEYDHLYPDIENYHLLGNHDFAIDPEHRINLLAKLSMPDFYYAYVKKDWRFIVLDATDYSFYANVLHKHDSNQVNLYYENTLGKTNHHRWNSAIGEEQQIWLKQELDSAILLDQKVILFSHMPLRPQANPHNLWNDSEIIQLIEKYSNVIAYINGHNHSGAHVYKNGIHYLTISGMVENRISSYGILEIYRDHLVLKGYGNQKSFHLNYR